MRRENGAADRGVVARRLPNDRHVPVRPNPALTRDCDYPTLDGETWRDLAQAYERRGEALRECTARLRAIRTGEI